MAHMHVYTLWTLVKLSNFLVNSMILSFYWDKMLVLFKYYLCHHVTLWIIMLKVCVRTSRNFIYS